MDRMSQQGHYFDIESMHFTSTNICLCSICPVVTSSGNGTIIDCHYILDAHDSYLGQHFRPAAPRWPDQLLNSYNNDGHALYWHLSPPMPYVQALSANGSSSENARIGRLRYHDTTNSRSGHRFCHPPLQYHSFHQYVQEIRGHSFNFHPPVTAPSYRVPTNPSPSSSILIHDAIEMGARHTGYVPFLGAHIHQSHRGNMHEATLRHQNHPIATVFLDDDVALLVDHDTDMHLDTEDMSYEANMQDVALLVDHHTDMRLDTEDMSYEAIIQDVDLLVDHHTDTRLDIEDMSYEAIIQDEASLVDHHADMRLDTEDMSYEELLALGEWIGNQKSGLSENIITSQVKTKTYLRSTNATNLEEAASEKQETDLCIICQDEYKNQEKIGILQCGHEYHIDCLKKWLLEKNVCPMCKSVALIPGEKCV